MPLISINTILLNGSIDGPRKVDMGFTQTCIMYVIPREFIPCAGNSRNGKIDWIDDEGHIIGEFLDGMIS